MQKGCYFCFYLFAVYGSEGKYLVPQYKGVMKKARSDLQKLETSTKADKRPAVDDIPIVTLNSSSDSDEPKVLFRVEGLLCFFLAIIQYFTASFSCLLGEVVWRGSHHQCQI
jgi:hypothetical protein